MKTFRMIGMVLFAVLMCVSFASCSEDDDPAEVKNENGVVTSGKKLVKLVETKESDDKTTTFNYDARGCLIAVAISSNYYEENSHFTWNKGTIVKTETGKYGGSTTYIITDGLVRHSDDDDSFIYNNSNKLIKHETYVDSYEAKWDCDKLVEIIDDGSIITFAYGDKTTKGFTPISLFSDILDGFTIGNVHPEIAGMRTTQLPISRTWNKEDIDTFEYEFDKDGYVSKIIRKDSDGEIYNTVTLIWE